MTRSRRTDWKPLVRLFEAIEFGIDDLQLRDDEKPWFRGAADSHDLRPALFRADLPRRERERREADFFFEFRARAQVLVEQRLTGWDVLFFMRHHGAPTRLLDWTESLFTALYFAVQHQEPTLWILDPYGLNVRCAGAEDREVFVPERLYPDRDFDDLLLPRGRWGFRVAALYPVQRSQRMFAQRAWFTFHGDQGRPLEEDPVTKPYSRKLVLSNQEAETVRSLLALGAVDEYLLFPDLDALVHTLATRYGFPADVPRGA